MLVLIFRIYLLLGDDDLNLRSNSHQEGGNDENMDNQDLNEVNQSFGGHMTMARTKRGCPNAIYDKTNERKLNKICHFDPDS